MKITQEKLNEIVKNYLGEDMVAGKDKKLTFRVLIIESIFSPDAERSGDEKLKGFQLASKVNERMGELELTDDEVKLIHTRADGSKFLESNDYLYGMLYEILK